MKVYQFLLAFVSWIHCCQCFNAAPFRLHSSKPHFPMKRSTDVKQAWSRCRCNCSIFQRQIKMSQDSGSVILVCTGDDCDSCGSSDLLKYARSNKPEGITCKSTGCLGMCGLGPAVAVEEFPGGPLEVFRDVNEEKMLEIFQEVKHSSK
mmetsp:Transcript_45162/g.142197  ORF Transcript_45162/g.142197 Transcript_45162/m.142197 type:complete len:149 (+) Transcript_45162:49-495(+)